MKPRCMMVIPLFRPIASGAELQAERLAIRLVQRGHEIHILTTLRAPGSLPEEEIQGVQVHRVGFKMADRILVGVESTFRYLFLTRNTYDILHVHQALGHAVVSIVAARVFGKRCIVKVAGAGRFGDLQRLSGFTGFRWALSILKHADRMIAISSDVEKELLEWGISPRRIERIPNGVDAQFFKREQPFPPRVPLRFILVGRRSQDKGIDIALQAAHILLQDGFGKAFEIKFYGRDYSGDYYQHMVEDLQVDALVEFLPYENEMRNVFHSAHALILPSRSEGMPNVVLEAMSFELPVIASRVSGVVDIIDDGVDGILIPVEDARALADAMSMILMDPELGVRLGKRARQKIISEFSLEHIADQYSDLYERLYGGR